MPKFFVSHVGVMEGTIATRTSHLNQLFLGRTNNSELRSSLAREGLLDALAVLYEECCHDQLRRDKHVATFVQKCKQTQRVYMHKIS